MSWKKRRALSNSSQRAADENESERPRYMLIRSPRRVVGMIAELRISSAGSRTGAAYGRKHTPLLPTRRRAGS